MGLEVKALYIIDKPNHFRVSKDSLIGVAERIPLQYLHILVIP
jgi:hypothetical protein